MQDHTPIGVETEDDAPLWTPTLRRRVLLGLIAALCILLLVVVPPYFSISRYQRRVATAISGALGRPVHFDGIQLHLLPIPGLTISNFVVSENPEFGYEPVLRANTVEARLRVSSLWRRRIEVSHISLDGPSINLVRRPDDGRWNLQSILMQASQLRSAPTAQQRAGEAPRFPYIEAIDARINIKSGTNKLPFSVKEAEFALWLPEPDQWRVRMLGKPVRTDTDVNDVGLLRVEATLGRAADLQNSPIALEAGWKPTPLGEAAKLTAGHDLGWRGEVSATASLHGTLGTGRLLTDLHLRSLHRADLLPEHTVEVDAHCEAATAGLLRGLHDVRCAVPTNTSLTLASVMENLRGLPAADSAAGSANAPAKPGVLLLQGEVPSLLDWQTAIGSATLHGADINYALSWAELFTRSIPATLPMEGSVDVAASLRSKDEPLARWTASLACSCVLPRAAGTQMQPEPSAATPKANRWTLLVSGASSSSPATAGPRFELYAEPAPAQAAPSVAGRPLNIVPNELAPITGALTREGYELRYTTRSAVEQAAALVPRLAEGLPNDAPGPLAMRAGWYTPQLWSVAPPPTHFAPPRRRRRHAR